MAITSFPIVPEVMTALVINSIIAFLTLLVVALRIMARIVVGSRLGWDDYLMVAALPQGLGILICQGLLAQAGFGRPLAVVSSNNDYIILVREPNAT